MQTVNGIHHVTAIAGDPQENLDFYVGVLGMRLVKKSVNQDVPDTYHLFYADGVGTPGSDITFFPWPQMAPARIGTGLAVHVSFAVPHGSLSYWRERLNKFKVAYGETETRFGETVLPFHDPHGLELALVETDIPERFVVWDGSSVPPEHQIRGMHSVRLFERRLAATERLLTERMGFHFVGEENGWRRFAAQEGSSGKIADLQEHPNMPRGEWGTGGVHHVAWRTNDVDAEMSLREEIARAGLQPTPLIDRFWFQSVYFREPGGTLFELATDGPGFDRDEDMKHLGEQLILPPWLEPHRAEIEAVLPPLRSPQSK
ncbi:MAG: ring-cleaving dioxygenase [Anaerolineae bacterium]|nr:ring-cleaving dioxygenase [Anaerolineae bacterium]